MTVGAGLRASVEHTVGAADTALAMGSGDVPVLATPRVLALAEQATVAAVADALADGQTSVGTRVDLEHVVASPVGATVVVEALLTDVDGSRLRFVVTVRDGDRVAATGTVQRAVVDREVFLGRLDRGVAPNDAEAAGHSSST